MSEQCGKLGPQTRTVGEQDFRDFSRLPPVKENRTQSADPTRANPMAPARKDFMSTNTVDGSTKNKEMETVLLDLIKTLEDSQKGFADIGDHLKDISPQAVLPGRKPQARQLPRRA